MQKSILCLLSPSKNEKTLLLLCIILLVILLPHITFLESKFIDGDDLLRVVQNPLIRNIHLQGLANDIDGFFSYHYPSFLLTYFWGCIFSIWELNHIGFHFISYLLHAICAGLVFLFLVRITGRVILSFFSTLIFGLHPIHCEAVNWICRQDMLLSTFFGLIFLHLSLGRGISSRIFAFFSILIAIIITPISFLFLIAKYLIIPADSDKPFLQVYDVITLACFLGIWGWKMFSFPFSNLFIKAPSSIYYMILSFIMPWKIHFMLPIFSGSFLSHGIFFLVLLFSAGWIFFRSHEKSWGLLLLMLLSAWLLHAYTGRFNGAWTYISLLWGSMAFGIGFSRITIENLYAKGFILFIALAIFSSFGVLTYKRNRAWRKTETLVKDSLQESPSDPMLLAMYGHYKAAMLDAKESEKAFHKIKEPSFSTLCLRAMSYHLLQQLRNASNTFGRLFKEYPKEYINKYCLFDYAVLKLQHGHSQEAKELYGKICRRDPYFIYAWHDLGTLFIRGKEEKRGLKMLNRALAIAPAYRPTLENLAIYYMKHREYKKAAFYVGSALKSTSCHDTQDFYRGWLASLGKKRSFKYASLRWAKLTPPG